VSSPERKIFLAAPMLGYRCNQKGCCCQGWSIPFQISDLARLAVGLPEDERERLGEGLELVVDPDTQEVAHVHLRRDGPERRCLFLEPEGGCEVHRRLGTDPLPDLCVTFPVVAYDAGDRVELHFEALCPSVLDEIENESTPFQEIELDQAAWPGLATRARKLMPSPTIRLGEAALDRDALRFLRQRALEALADTGRPAVEHLAALCYAFDRLRATGDLAQFEIRHDEPLEPFFDFLEWCARAHDARVLSAMWDNYRRFVWGIERDDPRLDPDALRPHLDHWGEALERWMAPSEPALRALLVRYLAHRYHSLFTRVQGGLLFSYGSAPQVYALAIRLAAAISGALARPTDAGIMKAGLGMADYIYRSLYIPAESLPWFTPYSEPEQPWLAPLLALTPGAQEMTPPGAPRGAQ
jgi:Fe-S-cluster containining protein